MMVKRGWFVLFWLIASVTFARDNQRSASVSTTTARFLESPLSAGLDIQYGSTTYDDYSWIGVPYSKQFHSAHLSAEWLPPITDGYGKIGVGLGIGLAMQNNIGAGKARLSLVPLGAFVSYRADFMKNQFLVPFGKVGTNTTFFRRLEGGTTSPTTSTYVGYNYGGGLEVCLNKIDPATAKEFDQAMGVNNTYFIFEYVKSNAFGFMKPSTDLSHSEYRFGLRFEM